MLGTRRFAAFAALFVMGGIATVANANTLQVSLNTTLTNVATGTFVYNVAETQFPDPPPVNFRAETTDFETVHGFLGLIGTPVFAADPTLVTLATGNTKMTDWVVSVVGNDITLTYRGTTGTGTANPINANQVIGTVTALSTIHSSANGAWNSNDHQLSGGVWGVSTGSGIVSVAAPLPATASMGLVLLGSIGGLGAFRRMKNGNSVEA